jgi:hypothetical protein
MKVVPPAGFLRLRLALMALMLAPCALRRDHPPASAGMIVVRTLLPCAPARTEFDRCGEAVMRHQHPCRLFLTRRAALRGGCSNNNSRGRDDPALSQDESAAGDDGNAAETAQWMSASEDPWASAPGAPGQDRVRGDEAHGDHVHILERLRPDVPAPAGGGVAELLSFLSAGSGSRTEVKHTSGEGDEQIFFAAVRAAGEEQGERSAGAVGEEGTQDHERLRSTFAAVRSAAPAIPQGPHSTVEAGLPEQPKHPPPPVSSEGARRGWVPDFEELDLPEPAPPLPHREVAVTAPAHTSGPPARAVPGQVHANAAARVGLMVLRSDDGRVLPKDVLGRYPPWLPGGAHSQQQLVDTNPLAMTAADGGGRGGAVAVYNPMYGSPNVSYAVAVPPQILARKLNQVICLQVRGSVSKHT